ncbi:MAG: permease [Alphaproteobacteria bacterium RIFCSPLOWO2_01_FULL_40_26]|nr:MAG: permease [Alphaproteobacteria bacterium RIFCSPHIGHO2_02_FULL_40_34]OFW89097.1 MAG: permease [Alphaproteobacteria bacterium RIFCSPHIGHO2_01_FULL_40_8]OFW94135.1 MAG: permease [Alphaproteobacteria bacterium RIFCSPLOWO2_01_FULL_40_26]OFX09379.1 MAG: permease [Alphaproteobacteria bacterium RIFCSPLOWO2_02_FULL_40_19]OFX10976.1 MAG: permease [Alphaproteobacteria bacterium RIFCSPLOWO2_12_FULL_40_11]
MQIYLPIAEIPVNILLVLLLGLIAGFLAGMFGIGGGFIATPLLMFIGIPPAISVATSTNQIISASVSGLLAHFRKGNVDVKMGLFLVLGGFFGSTFGVSIFRFLQTTGHIDIVIALVYVLFLGAISITMLVESVRTLVEKKYGVTWEKSEKSHMENFLAKIDNLPCQSFFPKSGITVSIFVPIILSFGIGILVALMGIGGGFLMIPAMIYILRMPSNMVVGTSLFQIVFIAANATFLQAVSNNTVDIILAFLMIISSAIGAQLGTRAGYRVDADSMRAFLALLLLAVCVKMMFVLFAEPQSFYVIEVLKR